MNTLWLQNAKNSAIFAEDGTFLVTTVSTGSHDIGWVSVRWTPEVDVSCLVDDRGMVEFIARSLAGHHICGVTAEEYDYWILSL